MRFFQKEGMSPETDDATYDALDVPGRGRRSGRKSRGGRRGQNNPFGTHQDDIVHDMVTQGATEEQIQAVLKRMREEDERDGLEALKEELRRSDLAEAEKHAEELKENNK
jgi:hypothetical protein